jgi:hypothetical protein
LVVVQIDTMNLLGIVIKGSHKLALNNLVRELFWFCLSHKIVLSVEWVPRESNASANDISKWSIPDEYSISRHYFVMLDYKWGPHTCETFSTNENSHYYKLYYLHWCRETSGVNGFVFNWSLDNGCGFLGMILLFSSRVEPRVAKSSPRRIGKLWPCGSTSLQANHIACSQSASAALKKVVMHAPTTLGGAALSLQLILVVVKILTLMIL